jgi:hypothetical protein
LLCDTGSKAGLAGSQSWPRLKVMGSDARVDQRTEPPPEGKRSIRGRKDERLFGVGRFAGCPMRSLDPAALHGSLFTLTAERAAPTGQGHGGGGGLGDIFYAYGLRASIDMVQRDLYEYAPTLSDRVARCGGQGEGSQSCYP